jgi:hypothetical protein
LGLTTDSSNQIYVGVTNAASDSQVLVYADGANGTAVPTRVIDVVSAPQCLFVDVAGKLYVGSSVGALQNIVVSVYAPDATGQAVPLRTVQSPTNEFLVDIVADLSGTIYVAGAARYDPGNIPYGFIDVYSPDAAGSAEPVRSISFPVFINGVAVNGNGNVFVSVESSLSTGVSQATSVAVEEFAPDANGYATPTRVINLPEQAVPAGESGSTGAGADLCVLTAQATSSLQKSPAWKEVSTTSCIRLPLPHPTQFQSPKSFPRTDTTLFSR